MYRKIIAVCSEIHTKHINILCGQDVEFLNDKPGGTCSDHWAFKSYKHPSIIIVISISSNGDVRASNGVVRASNGRREEPYIYFRMALLILDSFFSLLCNIIP